MYIHVSAYMYLTRPLSAIWLLSGRVPLLATASQIVLFQFHAVVLILANGLWRGIGAGVSTLDSVGIEIES